MDNYSYNQNLLHNHLPSHSNTSSSLPYPSSSYLDYHQHPQQQYPATTPRNAAPVSDAGLINSLDGELPSEGELMAQTPEQRAVILEMLKERRRVKELELKILEERRREREASSMPSNSNPPMNAAMSAMGGWQDTPTCIERLALSAVGTNRLPSLSTSDFGPSRLPETLKPHYSHHQQTHHAYPSSSSGSNFMYDGGHQGLATQLPSPAKNYDPLSSELGLQPPTRPIIQPITTTSQARDAYGNVTFPSRSSHVQQHPPVIGSPESPSAATSSAQPGGTFGGAPYSGPRSGLWDTSRSIATPSLMAGHLITSKALTPPHGHPASTPPSATYSALPRSAGSTGPPSTLVPSPGHPLSADLDLQPLHLFDDANYQAGYAVSSSGGSNYDEPSPPQNQFFPTPPQQHLQYPDPTYQHPSMQVKHPRLSDPTPGPSYHPSQQSHQPLHVFSDQTQANNLHHNDAPVSPVVDTSSSAAANSRKVKKQLLERQINCQTCQTPICKMLVRGTVEELSVAYEPFYECLHCAPPAQLPIAPSGSLPVSAGGAYGSGGGGFTGSGLRMTRKRTRQTEDTSMPTVCDVCIRTIGRGGLVPQVRSSPLAFAVEVVCMSCSGKYSRCSDCGGGSGRVGVGKWRAKELFENGRKTCKLPHVRVGGGELELSVWEVPWEIQDKKEFPQLMAAIKTLWSERIYARLAIPEVLEGGEEEWSPGGIAGSSTQMSPDGQATERTFKDVEDCVAKGWPAREKVLRTAPSLNHDHFRRYLGLSWAKSRARRERAAGKLPDPSKYAEGAEDVLAENVRRTAVIVPPASTLVGMWLVDWDIRNRTMLLSTSAPFEPSDAEDKNIIGVGEIFTRVMKDFVAHNLQNPNNQLKPPQHVWVATRSLSALGNARMNDTLTRRRGFVPVDEYIALHPGTDRALFQSAPDGHGWFEVPGWKRQEPGELEVLVRWLGDDMDMDRLEEIKDIEYGRKSKEVQIAARSRKVAPMPTRKSLN